MIRDRAAKFYRDHTTGCNIFVAGLLSGVVVATKRANKRLEVISVETWFLDGDPLDRVTVVTQKNGRETRLGANANR